MADDKRSSHDTVTLTIPGHAVYLRLARLAAADTGARAGLSIGDLEDLRIAVDELAYALIGADTTRRAADLALSAPPTAWSRSTAHVQSTEAEARRS